MNSASGIDLLQSLVVLKYCFVQVCSGQFFLPYNIAQYALPWDAPKQVAAIAFFSSVIRMLVDIIVFGPIRGLNT